MLVLFSLEDRAVEVACSGFLDLDVDSGGEDELGGLFSFELSSSATTVRR